jgi:hypothetical protein
VMRVAGAENKGLWRAKKRARWIFIFISSTHTVIELTIIMSF